MSEQKERGSLEEAESRPMTKEEVLQKIQEISGIQNLEVEPTGLIYNDKGELIYLVTKTIWNEKPDEDGIYHGIAFWFDSAANKNSRSAFREFNNIIVKIDWKGKKKGEIIEEDEEEGEEVIADW